MPYARVLVLAATVLLAGCAGLGVDAGPAPTITPAPIPEATPTPVTPPHRSLATGVTSYGVEDVDRLAAGHRAALANRSYTVVIASSIVGSTGGNWTDDEPRREDERVLLLATRQVIRVDAGGFPRSVVGSVDGPLSSGLPIAFGIGAERRGPPATSEVWTDGVTSYRRTVADGTVTFAVGTASVSASTWPDPTAMDQLRPRFEAVPTRASPMSSTGRWVIVDGYAPTVGRPALVTAGAPVSEPTDVELTARVARSGLVIDFALDYAATVDGQPVEVHVSVEVQDLDATSVGQPPWVANARNATG